MTEATTDKKGKIVAIVFLLLILMPICYVVIKELVLNKDKPHNTSVEQPVSPGK